MSQNPISAPNTGTLPGLTMVNDYNAAFDTVATNFSGNSAPGTPKTYQLWADTTNNILKIYDGSTWLPIGKFSGSQFAPISNGVSNNIPASTGSANAYVVTYSPVPSALVTGQTYSFIANFGNTSTATLNINGLGAHALTKRGTVALAGSEIASGSVIITVWDGTQFQIVGEIARITEAGSFTTISASGNTTLSGTLGVTGPITPSQTNGIVGTTTNNNANSGAIGEYVSSSVVQGSAVGLTTGTPANITSIILTAGDWDVSGNVVFLTDTATSYSIISGGISSVSATQPSSELRGVFTEAGAVPGIALLSVGVPTQRISMGSTTTIYLVSFSTFSVSTMSTFGTISARRVR